jgi:hypothetical protein
MEIESSFVCVYCFELNETIVDASGGLHQEYIEDCQVCCRPNALTIVVADDLQSAEITADVA